MSMSLAYMAPKYTVTWIRIGVIFAEKFMVLIRGDDTT